MCGSGFFNSGKLKSFAFILLLFLLLLLTSCDTDSDDARKLAEKYATQMSQDACAIGDFDWLTVDNSNAITSDDNSDGIFRLADSYLLNGGRLYFSLSRDHCSTMWAYIDESTGENFYLCPDPLCQHTRDGGCKYTDIDRFIFDGVSNDIIYAVKINFIDDSNASIAETICRIDAANDKLTELYQPELGDARFANLDLLFISDGRLFFTQTLTREVLDESGEIRRESETIPMALELDGGTATTISSSLSAIDYQQFKFATDAHLYFFNDAEGCLYATELNFTGKKTVFELGADNTCGMICCDTNTGELFIPVCSNYIAGHYNYAEKREEGHLYRVDDATLECSMVDMPTDKLINAQVTKNYIYYTEYQLVDYSPGRHGRCVVVDGSKIYRANRADTSESELIFDGRGEFFYLYNFFADGNYLYLGYSKLELSDEMTYFRYMGVTARINFKNNTVKWIC